MSFTEYFKNFKTLEPCYRLLFLEPVNSQIVNSLLAQHAFHIQINQSLNQPPLFNSPIKAITCRARYYATGDHPYSPEPSALFNHPISDVLKPACLASPLLPLWSPHSGPGSCLPAPPARPRIVWSPYAGAGGRGPFGNEGDRFEARVCATVGREGARAT